jgi:acyl dehydratase
VESRNVEKIHKQQDQDRLASIKMVAHGRLKPVVVEIEKRMIKRFVEAIGDTNPLWVDANYGFKAGLGGIVAPPFLFCTPMLFGVPLVPEVPGYYKRGLFGGWDIELFRYIRLGDVITATSTVAHVREQDGKLGKMLLIDYETEHCDQSGKLIARSTGTIIHYGVVEESRE